MDLIETLNPEAFSDYLKRYNNTICGRHPIGVMLQVFTDRLLSRYFNCFDVFHLFLIVGGSNITKTRLSNELQIFEI